MRRFSLTLLALCTVIITTPSQANVVHVNRNAGGVVHDGTTWQTAFLTVAEGIQAAAAGDEIWVAASQPAAPAYIETITLLKGITLYGGFSGTEASRDLRDPAAHPTILDGERRGPVLRINVTAPGSVTVDGFTIRNGRAGIVGSAGGGLVISNNIISSNVNQTGGESGGISVGGTATITRNTITDNTAIHGKGGGIASSGTATVTYNVIARNTASVAGGAIYSTGPLTAANNLIVGNTTEGYGGGIYLLDTCMIANNTIVANSGGGISAYNASGTLANNIIAFNSSGLGGNIGTAMAVTHNDVYGNMAGNYTGLPDQTGLYGNISEDPLLSDLYGRPHLKPGSPCIDVAPYNAVMGTTDIDGQPRIQGTRADIGADESDGSDPADATSVLHVAPGGDDANDGRTWGAAKKTLAAAMAVAHGGDEVWVAGGTYSENAVVPLGVSLYGGFAGTETRRDERDWAKHVTILDGGQTGAVLAIGFGGVTVDGFTIRNGSASGVQADAMVSLAHNVISGNNRNDTMTSGGTAIDAHAALTVVDCLITGNTGGGAYSGTVVVNGWADIRNCTLAANASGTAALYIVGEATVTNSIVARNNAGIFLNGGGNLTFRRGDVFGNTGFDFKAGEGATTATFDNLAQDPLFVDAAAGDFRLQPGSPCVDAGDDAAAVPGSFDLDRKPRRIGSHVDIGAYEFGTPVVAPFAFPDLGRALRIAIGAERARAEDMGRLDIVPGSGARIDLADAAAIARKVAGTDWNP